MQNPPYVLLIDDEPDNHRILSAILKGYQMRAVLSVDEARPLLNGAPPDVVLLDIMLPGTNGLAFLEELNERCPGVPVIVVTAYGTMSCAVEALRSGAYDFIQKPFQPEVLRASVQRAAEHRHHYEQRTLNTDRLRARNAELEAAQVRVSAMQTMALVGELAQGLIHEIANPLSVIRINNSLLRVMCTAGGDCERRFDSIDRAIDRVQQSVEMLNAFSFRPQEPKQVSIEDVVAPVVQSLLNSGQLRACQVTVELPPDLPLLEVRPDQIGQALHNILLNAEEATQESGQLSCDVLLTARVEERTMRLDIANSGPLIPAEDLERVFEPLFTTRRDEGRVRGLGLGLFMARNVVEANGGRLEVSSEPEEGVIVSMLLPLAAPTTAPG